MFDYVPKIISKQKIWKLILFQDETETDRKKIGDTSLHPQAFFKQKTFLRILFQIFFLITISSLITSSFLTAQARNPVYEFKNKQLNCDGRFRIGNIYAINNRRILLSKICGEVGEMHFSVKIGDQYYNVPIVYIDEDNVASCREKESFDELKVTIDCGSTEDKTFKRYLELPKQKSGNNLADVVEIIANDTKKPFNEKCVFKVLPDENTVIQNAIGPPEKEGDLECYKVEKPPAMGTFVPGSNCTNYITSDSIYAVNTFKLKIQSLECIEKFFPANNDDTCSSFLEASKMLFLRKDGKRELARILPSCSMLHRSSKQTLTVELPENQKVKQLKAILLINQMNGREYCRASLNTEYVIKDLPLGQNRRCGANKDPAKVCTKVQIPTHAAVHYSDETYSIGSTVNYSCKGDYDPNKLNLFRVCKAPVEEGETPKWFPTEEKWGFECVYAKITECREDVCEHGKCVHHHSKKPTCICDEGYAGRRCNFLNKDRTLPPSELPKKHHRCYVPDPAKFPAYNTKGCKNHTSHCHEIKCNENYTGTAKAKCLESNTFFHLSGCHEKNTTSAKTKLSTRSSKTVKQPSVPSSTNVSKDSNREICPKVRIANGKAKFLSGTSLGHSVTYSCNIGFNKSKNYNTSVCKYDEKGGPAYWDPEIPTCVGSNGLCKLDLSLLHPNVSIKNTSDKTTDAGSKILFDCKNNKRPNIQGIFCNKHGVWDPMNVAEYFNLSSVRCGDLGKYRSSAQFSGRPISFTLIFLLTFLGNIVFLF